MLMLFAGRLSAFAAARHASHAKQPQEQTVPVSDSASSWSAPASEVVAALRDHVQAAIDGPAEQLSINADTTVRNGSKAIPDVILSTFVSNQDNVIRDDDKVLEVKLRSDEFITFVGIYEVKVLTGVVSISGALIHPDSPSQRVYAPTTHALPQLTAKKDGTILHIATVKSGMTGLGRFSSLFRNIWNASEDAESRSFSAVTHSSDDPLQRSLVPLEIDEHYKRVLSKLNSRLNSDERAPLILTIGAKSSGKSTFNRLLSNMIVSRFNGDKCLYFDLDPGQPEFGPPGQVSLVEVTVPIFGPPFTHPAAVHAKSYRCIRSHTIAATTFKDDPEHYVACCVDLIRYALQDVPVVINTCGWVTGMGASVLTQLADKFAVSEVVILEPVESSLLSAMGRPGRNIHRVPRRLIRASVRTPAEHRTMQTMACFHHKWSSDGKHIHWMAKPIHLLRPWIVSYDDESRDIIAIWSYGQSPHPNFLGEVLNGSLVAIILPDSEGLISPGTVQYTPAEGLPYLSHSAQRLRTRIDPRHSRFVGLALVRGIDVTHKTLLLTTPLTPGEIDKIQGKGVVLVRGNFDCPEWAYLEDVNAGEELDICEERPWVSHREQKVGIEGAIWRLRHPPGR